MGGGENWIRGAVCREFGAPLSVERLRLSPPRAGQVRVKISVCAICHSDLTYMDGGWGGAPPFVFGHEGAGIVLEVGGDSQNNDAGNMPNEFRPGDRVVVTLLRSCGKCRMCAAGFRTQCEGEFDNTPHLHDENGAPVVAGLKTGAFAEEVVVDISQIAPVPSSLSFVNASLLACGVLTGWGAVANTARVPSGASVAVVGCGGVGLNCLQAAAAAGAAPVAAADISAEKLRLAKTFGATAFINVQNESPDKAKEITGGRGFDYVFMAAGAARAAEYAAELVAKTGALILAGMPPNGDLAKLNTTTVAQNQQRILGSKMGGANLRADIPKLLRMLDTGKLKLSELVGGRYALDEINDAVAAARKDGARRSVVVFDGAESAES